jgi:ceramide glucosyltransferase
VDDMHIGTHVIAAGLRNVMSSEPIRLIEWGLTFPEFAKTARRWLVFSRSGIPARLALNSAFHYLVFWLGLASLVAGVAAGAWAVALAGVALVIATTATLLALNTATGGPPVPVRWWWMPTLVLVAVPFLYMTTWMWPHVIWRGRTYDLNAKAELNTRREPLLTRIRRFLHA